MAINYSEFSPCKLRGKEIEHLRIHKSKSKYLFDFRHNGNRYRKVYIPPTNDTLSNNTDRAKEALLRFKNEKMNTIKSNPTVNEVYVDFYNALTASDKHKMNIRGIYANRIKPIIGSKKIKAIRATHISAILEKSYKLDRLTREPILDKSGKKIPSGLRVKKAIHEVLTSIFTRALQDEIINELPIKAHHNIKRDYGSEKKIVSDAEIKYRAVHRAIHELFKDDPKHRALFLLGFYGRRRNEVLTLKWSDISENDNTYIIRAENSKVNKDMKFTLPDDVAKALNELRPKRDSEYIFSSNVKPSVPLTNITHYSKKIKELTNINEFSFHYMRNLSVSALSAMGVDTTHLSALLGHTDAATLKKYLSLQREHSSEVALNASKQLLG